MHGAAFAGCAAIESDAVPASNIERNKIFISIPRGDPDKLKKCAGKLPDFGIGNKGLAASARLASPIFTTRGSFVRVVAVA